MNTPVTLRKPHRHFAGPFLYGLGRLGLLIGLLGGLLSGLVGGVVAVGRGQNNPNACLRFGGMQNAAPILYDVGTGSLLRDRRPPRPVSDAERPIVAAAVQGQLHLPEGHALRWKTDPTTRKFVVTWHAAGQEGGRQIATGFDDLYDVAHQPASGLTSFNWWRIQPDGKWLGGTIGLTNQGEIAYAFTFPDSAIYRYAVVLAVHPDRNRAVVRIVYSDYPVFGAAYLVFADGTAKMLRALRVPFGGAAWTADGRYFILTGQAAAPSVTAAALYDVEGELVRQLPPLHHVTSDSLAWTNCR